MSSQKGGREGEWWRQIKGIRKRKKKEEERIALRIKKKVKRTRRRGKKNKIKIWICMDWVHTHKRIRRVRWQREKNKKYNCPSTIVVYLIVKKFDYICTN